MPWKDQSIVTIRNEFVIRARQEGASMTALCRQYGISRKTGSKWLARADGDGGDRPRTPHHQPRRSAPEIEQAVLAMRARYPCWGGRKLEVKLREAGLTDVPRPSTITAILQRHGLLPPRQARPAAATRRFEYAAPHDLWQMDFMGHRAMQTGRVHPLTILDDHSRVLLSLTACPHEQLDLVWALLDAGFGRYGLPRAILTDNGPPWGTSGGPGVTRLDAWLLRLGVELWHGRPRHPQTQGKVARIHETIRVEAFGTRTFRDLAAAQAGFDAFRMTYNLDRPHEALGYVVPMSRLQPSPRPLPDALPPPVLCPGGRGPPGPEPRGNRVREPELVRQPGLDRRGRGGPPDRPGWGLHGSLLSPTGRPNRPPWSSEGVIRNPGNQCAFPLARHSERSAAESRNLSTQRQGFRLKSISDYPESV